MRQPKSFEDLLHKYVSRMKTEYGYMIRTDAENRIICDAEWTQTSDFLEKVIFEDGGLTTDDNRKLFRAMETELNQWIEDYHRTIV